MTTVHSQGSQVYNSLSKLIERVTGLAIDPEQVRKLVSRHWREVQSCAHQIREDDIERRAVERFKRSENHGASWNAEAYRTTILKDLE